MRILYISNSTSSAGAPAAIFNIVKEISPFHQVAVVLPDATGPLFKNLTTLGIKCYTSVPYRLTIWPGKVNPVKFLRRLSLLKSSAAKDYVASVIEEFKPDIVHTNVGPLDLALDICKQKNLPHVWHLREYQQDMEFYPSEKDFRRKILSEGNTCIAITKGIFSHWGLDSRHSIIYDGVIDSLAEACPMESRQRYFLYVGRIEKNKGLSDVLKAFKQSGLSESGYRLKVAGASSRAYALKCRLLTRIYGLGSFVDFLGVRKDVPELMRSASAFVMSSYSEGFGFTTVEAMAHGCPVIGRNTTGTKEQFDIGLSDTGREIGIRFNDTAELAAAMRKTAAAYEDKADGFSVVALRAMTAAAKNVVGARYLRKRCAEEIVGLYEKLINENR